MSKFTTPEAKQRDSRFSLRARISLEGIPIASVSVEHMFRRCLVALLSLGLVVCPFYFLHTFPNASGTLFGLQCLVLCGGSGAALIIQRQSMRKAGWLISICTLVSVLLSIGGGPLSDSWILLAVVPMIFWGFRWGLRGIILAIVILCLSIWFWSFVQAAFGGQKESFSKSLLIVYSLGRCLTVALSGLVIAQLMAIVRERETFLLNVFSDIDIGVSVFDVDEKGELRVAAVNPRLYQLFNLSKGKVIGRTFDELLASGKFRLAESIVKRAVETGEIQHNEDRGRSGDRHQRLLFTAVPQKDDEHRVRRLVVSGTDITPLKEAERKLRLQAKILENVADAVVATNVTFEVTYLNRAAERLFSAANKSVLGRPLDELTGPELLRELTRHVTGNTEVRSGTFNDLKGRELTLEYSVSTLQEDDGETAQYLAVFRDVRQKRSLEAQLLRAQKTDALGRMAGGIAHDFNNMLVVISGNAELLSEALPKEHTGQVDLREIKDAAQRAATLVRQLLAFSRRQTGTPRPCKVNDILRSNQQLLRRLLRDEIDLFLDLEEPLWSIVADVEQLEQVLVQLLLNAKDAIAETGQVTVKTRNVRIGQEGDRYKLTPGNYVEVRVTDTGVGMSSETMRHIFEPFFSTKSSSRSVGMGLPVCYGIVRQHRGSITAESHPGKGSEFILWLPEESNRAQEESMPPVGSFSDEFRKL